MLSQDEKKKVALFFFELFSSFSQFKLKLHSNTSRNNKQTSIRGKVVHTTKSKISSSQKKSQSSLLWMRWEEEDSWAFPWSPLIHVLYGAHFDNDEHFVFISLIYYWMSNLMTWKRKILFRLEKNYFIVSHISPSFFNFLSPCIAHSTSRKWIENFLSFFFLDIDISNNMYARTNLK